MSKKQATKSKAPLSVRAGRWFGRNLPGNAKRIGRATGRGAKNVSEAAKRFGESFIEGFKEV